ASPFLLCLLLFLRFPLPPRPPLFPYTTLFRSSAARAPACCSASLSSHSIDTAPSKPARFSSIMISSTELASRCVPAVTKFHPLRSEEHTSELQSLTNLVCRLLLEKKNNPTHTY